MVCRKNFIVLLLEQQDPEGNIIYSLWMRLDFFLAQESTLMCLPQVIHILFTEVAL